MVTDAGGAAVVLSGLGPGSAIWLEKSPSHKVCALTR